MTTNLTPVLLDPTRYRWEYHDERENHFGHWVLFKDDQNAGCLVVDRLEAVTVHWAGGRAVDFASPQDAMRWIETMIATGAI